MDDESYDALLDDLESMGAISPAEKTMLGYGNWLFAGYPDENGDMPDMISSVWVSPADKELLFDRRDAGGDVFRWINDRIQWTGGSSDPLTRIRIDRAFKTLADIINRMHVERSRMPSEAETAREKQRTSSGEREEILEQLRSGEFFTEATARILEMTRKLEEEKKKQATIDALSEMLDSISGRDSEEQDSSRETANGLKLGLSADQENTFKKGFMPLELQVYLRNLGVGGAFDAAEPDEDEEVRETGDAESTEKRKQPEELAAELAENYDPRNMTADEFRSFMDAVAESGAMSAGAAERIKNSGQWVVTVQDQYGNAVEPLAWKENGGIPADSRIMPFLFGEHGMDGDVLAWARLGSANSDFRDLADILSRMENQRKQTAMI